MEKKRHRTIRKDLPADIIEDILLKLPVKSLIQFKCVSKPWCSLITNPGFARNQLNQHLTNSHHRRHHNSLLLKNMYGVRIVEHEDEELASKISPHVFPKMFPLPFIFNPQQFKISGCCDGILCLVYKHDGFVLWNPRIGQYKKITRRDPYLGMYEVVGFGYDSSIDDYKVVRAPSIFREGRSFQNSFIVQVLKLKSNTWETVHHYFPFPFTIAANQPATTVNGGIYWFADVAAADPEGGIRRIALVCFDLGEEKFREVALPPGLTGSNIIPRLGLARGCLCMLTKKKSKGYFDLWVLNVDSTWAKLFTIPSTGQSFNHYFQPVCFAKNGAYLFNVGGDKLLMYDLKENTKFLVQGILSWTELIVYADSLVSPCTV